jgi:hypothetical protein
MQRERIMMRRDETSVQHIQRVQYCFPHHSRVSLCQSLLTSSIPSYCCTTASSVNSSDTRSTNGKEGV